MKKYIGPALALGLAVTLAGCVQEGMRHHPASGDDDDDVDASTPPPTKRTPDARQAVDAEESTAQDASAMDTSADDPVAIRDAGPVDGRVSIPDARPAERQEAGAPDVVTSVVGMRVSLAADLSAKWVNEGTIGSENGVTTYKGELPAGEIGGASGHTVTLKLSPGREYIFEYRLRFDGSFPWTKGGKLPGLAGGTAPTGCVDVNSNGFSARLMWREGGSLIGYIYDQDQDTSCGNDISTSVTFKAGTWYAIKERIRLNTKKNHDGLLQVSVDNRMVINRSNMDYMDEAPANKIDRVLFHIFFGGSTDDWAPSKNCSITFSEPYATLVAE